jgi:hypothetical protein
MRTKMRWQDYGRGERTAEEGRSLQLRITIRCTVVVVVRIAVGAHLLHQLIPFVSPGKNEPVFMV